QVHTGALPSAAIGVALMFRLLRHQPRHWMVFIGLVDATLLIFAVALAMRVRYAAAPAAYAEFSEHLLWRSGLFAAAILLCQVALGLYQPQTRESRFGIFVRQAVGCALGTLLLIILYYPLPQAYIGRGVLSLAILFGFTALAAWRIAALSLM